MTSPLVAAAAWIGVLLLAQDDGKKEEKDIRLLAEEKLREFAKVMRDAKDDDSVVAALRDLGQIQHPKILKKLAGYVGRHNDKISMAAATEISKYRDDPNAGKILLPHIKNAQRNAKDEPQMLAHYIDCFGKTRPKQLISEVTRYLFFPNHVVVMATVAACGETRSRAVVEPLIQLGKDLEKYRRQPSPAASHFYLAMRDAKLKLLDVVLGILKDLTGEDYKDPFRYEVWWKQNARTWKEPE